MGRLGSEYRVREEQSLGSTSRDHGLGNLQEKQHSQQKKHQRITVFYFINQVTSTLQGETGQLC